MYEQLISAMSQDDTYIGQIFEHYRNCFVKTAWCDDFVKHSPRIPIELRAHEYVGLCDRSIASIVPCARTLEGGAIRGSLQHSGLITATGGELFRGCIVFPSFDESGKITEAIGYRYGKRIRHWQPAEIYWAKPNCESYVFNGMTMAKQVMYAKAHQ
jgi:hypothetical protein